MVSNLWIFEFMIVLRASCFEAAPSLGIECVPDSRVVSAFGMCSSIEPVSNPADADQEAWFSGLRFDFLAQRDDMVIDDTVGEERSLAPRFIEKFFTAQNAST